MLDHSQDLTPRVETVLVRARALEREIEQVVDEYLILATTVDVRAGDDDGLYEALRARTGFDDLADVMHRLRRRLEEGLGVRAG